MPLLQSWAHTSVQSGQVGFLVLLGDSFLSFFPCLLAFDQHGMPQPARLRQRLRQQPLLALGGIQAGVERRAPGWARTLFIQSCPRAVPELSKKTFQYSLVHRLQVGRAACGR